MSDVDVATKRQAQIDGLREMLDLLEAQPGLRLPYWLIEDQSVYATDEADLLLKRKMLGKTVDKVVTDSFFGFAQHFGPITLKVLVQREVVCERVKTGTKHIEAVEAHDVDTYEYVCPESFLMKLGEAS